MPMRNLFLFGDNSDTFADASAPFVAACGGREARIAFLTTGGSGAVRHLPPYRDPWLALGAAEVVHIQPGDDDRISSEDVQRLSECTGIFMCGGDPRHYHRLYVQSPIGPVIRALYLNGIPYGGVSAGALLATGTAILIGDRVTTPENSYRIRAVYPEPCELQLGEGLGLLRDCVVEAHFAERGGFPRLLEAMRRAEAGWGLGVDEPACLHLVNEREMTLYGRGRAYVLRRTTGGEVGLRVMEPGDRALMAPSPACG